MRDSAYIPPLSLEIHPIPEAKRGGGREESNRMMAMGGRVLPWSRRVCECLSVLCLTYLGTYTRGMISMHYRSVDMYTWYTM